MSFELDKDYGNVLQQLKEKIRQARLRAAISVNKELLSVYWEIGNTILQQQKKEGWGTKVIDRLIVDLKTEFSDMKGLSPRNIKYMRAFAGAYPHFAIVQSSAAQLQITDNQPSAFVQATPAQITNTTNPAIVQTQLAQLSWYHHTTLLDKIKDGATRNFYIQKTAEAGWSRNIMVHQIESRLHERQGALTNNFEVTLPAYDSELAMQLFKDPYQLDFIMLGDEAKERDLEDALMKHITKLLLELGDGFAFMGRQKKLEAGGKEFFIDLLFYNTKLRRYIIIDLKIGEFEAEFVSKMNLYLGIADDTIKGEYDNPAIGLILCKTKNKIVAEYALRDTSKPIGIAEYKIAEILPEDIKGELPSIEEIETRLDEELKEQQTPVDARLKIVKEKFKQFNVIAEPKKITSEFLVNVFLQRLKPLWAKLIEKLNGIFENQSLNHITEFSINPYSEKEKTMYSINEVEETILKESDVKKLRCVEFNYKISGFIKEASRFFSTSACLSFAFYEYYYTISGSYNEITKKMYDEIITNEEVRNIFNKLTICILEDFEWFVRTYGKKDK